MKENREIPHIVSITNAKEKLFDKNCICMMNEKKN